MKTSCRLGHTLPEKKKKKKKEKDIRHNFWPQISLQALNSIFLYISHGTKYWKWCYRPTLVVAAPDTCQRHPRCPRCHLFACHPVTAAAWEGRGLHLLQARVADPGSASELCKQLTYVLREGFKNVHLMDYFYIFLGYEALVLWWFSILETTKSIAICSCAVRGGCKLPRTASPSPIFHLPFDCSVILRL